MTGDVRKSKESRGTAESGRRRVGEMSMVNIPVEPPITEYLHNKASRLGIPLNGTFELTPLCNMNCRMCYVRMSKEEQEKLSPLVSAEDWIALGEEAKRKGMIYLLLTGGEPFSRPDFKKIMQELHKMGFLISINSNGTMIDEEVVSWLKETPPVRINITLYGASDETYERLCRNPKGFTQVTKAIRLLKEAGILVKLNCSLTPYNAHDLEKIFAFAREEELVVQATSYMFPPMRRDVSLIGSNDRFTPEEAAYYAARIEALQKGEELFAEHVREDRIEGLRTDTDDSCLEMEGDRIRCRAGRCSFWVTWTGEMLPCGMVPSENAVNVFREGFDHAWESARCTAEGIRLPAKCSKCNLKDRCRACAAMVVTESGDYRKVPEYRCRMTQQYASACRKVAAEITASGRENIQPE